MWVVSAKRAVLEYTQQWQFLGQGLQGKKVVSFISPVDTAEGDDLLNTQVSFLISEIEAWAFKTK